MSRRFSTGLSFVGFPASVGIGLLIASCAESASSDPPADAGFGQETETVLPDTSHCEPGVFCRVDVPTTSPVSLNGIWGSGLDDVWIVGSPHFTLHWNGTRLATTSIETRQALFGVWGTRNDNVWTFGTSRALWRSSGEDSGWVRASGPSGPSDGGSPIPIFAMWGSGESDIWAVGASLRGVRGAISPSVFHCDGWRDGAPQWRASITSLGGAVPEPISFNAICGNTNSGIWIVGNGGKIRHTTAWQGDHAAWTPVNSQTSRNLFAVWCGPDGDAWVSGEGGTMLRMRRVGGDNVSVEAVGVPATASLRALWGTAADDLWAVGDAGTILHWDGNLWSVVDTSIQSMTEDLFAIWGAYRDNVWIAGHDVLLHKGNARLPRRSR